MCYYVDEADYGFEDERFSVEDDIDEGLESDSAEKVSSKSKDVSTKRSSNADTAHSASKKTFEIKFSEVSSSLHLFKCFYSLLHAFFLRV